MPMVTATRATESVARSSRAKEERKAIRSVRMVACRYSEVIARIDSAWALARPKTLRVGRPATTSRKWPESRESSFHCRSIRAWVYQPMRIMKSGMSGSVTTMMAAETQSSVTIRARTATGTTTARPNWGR